MHTIPTSIDHLTQAQARDAIDRWGRRAVAHARDGEHREAADADSEALDLRRAFHIDR